MHATTVTRTDVHMRQATPFLRRFMLGASGRPKRRILGLEFARGRRESARRSRSSRWGTGSSAPALLACAPLTRGVRLRARSNGLSRASPQGLTFEQAASADGAFRALSGLRAGDCRAGDRTCSSTARPARSGPRLCSSRRTSARTSPPSATRRTSSSSARSAPTRSSTTSTRTSRRTARRTTSILDAVGKHSFLRCEAR